MTDPITIERQVMIDAIETVRTLCSILEYKDLSDEEVITVKSLLKKVAGIHEADTKLMKPYELFYNVLSEMAECKKDSHCLTISDRLDAVRVANLFRNTGFKVEIKNEGLLYILRLNNQK